MPFLAWDSFFPAYLGSAIYIPIYTYVSLGEERNRQNRGRKFYSWSVNKTGSRVRCYGFVD